MTDEPTTEGWQDFDSWRKAHPDEPERSAYNDHLRGCLSCRYNDRLHQMSVCVIGGKLWNAWRKVYVALPGSPMDRVAKKAAA